jgi:hypothetical protein
VLDYARLVRAIQHDPSIPPGELATGSVYVCGVGQLSVALLLAVADLEDTRNRQRASPDDPAAGAALAAAESAVRAELGTATGAGAASPIPEQRSAEAERHGTVGGSPALAGGRSTAPA